MATKTITKEFLRERDLVVIPRKEYENLLDLREEISRRPAETKDTKDIDAAVRVYKQEKKQKKLRVLKSLADLR